MIDPVGTVQVYDVAPLTGKMLYTCIWLAHTAVDPVMDPGVAGAPFTVADRVKLVPQRLDAFTATIPLVRFGGNVTLILAVPWPLFKTDPAGTVQI